MAGARRLPLRIAIDTGGTFTDCVWVVDGRVRMLKVFSTPADPSLAIVTALEKIAARESLVLLHGTTVGTNTLLQRAGARVALVTTAGFEDAVEIGRQARPKLYDFFFDRVEPLVERDLRFGVEERTGSDGRVVEKPSAEKLAELASRAAAKHPEAIAICLLFSFANPGNEIAVSGALRRLGVPMSVSHEILPEFREYERMSTVVMNASLQPVMQHYLGNLERRAREWVRGGQLHAIKPSSSTFALATAEAVPSRQDGRQRVPSRRPEAGIFVMQSSGGITSLASAAREPVRTVLSGPAGGVVGAAAVARRSGAERIISFDMGGTSCDVALVDREVRTGSQAEVAGLPVGVPILDIHTVGAGGGSIARFDAAGALRVGPESAGADPGPICYGRGTLPTVTDANLILGRLEATRFLGGEFTPQVERTRRVTGEWLARSGSNLSLEQFAAGVIRVVNATMEKAIRVVSIERGYDPREFALVAFGGAGGLHACELAESLGIPRVIIPAMPGALSAFGILVSDVVKDYSRTVLWRASGRLPREKLEREFRVLRQAAEKDLRGDGWSGTIESWPSVEVRYRGQGYELQVPYSPRLIEDFEAEHRRRYGYRYPGREVELVTLRLRAAVKSPQANLKAESAPGARGRVGDETWVFFDGKRKRSALYARESLSLGRRYFGPAVLTEYGATTVVPPERRFWVDGARNLRIDVGRRRS